MDTEKKYNLIRQNAITALFFGFLKINNVYYEFLANYKEQGSWKEERLEHTLKKEPQKAINFSFCWSDTPQGHEFWYRLSYDWHEFLSNFNVYYEKQRIPNNI